MSTNNTDALKTLYISLGGTEEQAEQANDNSEMLTLIYEALGGTADERLNNGDLIDKIATVASGAGSRLSKIKAPSDKTLGDITISGNKITGTLNKWNESYALHLDASDIVLEDGEDIYVYFVPDGTSGGGLEEGGQIVLPYTDDAETPGNLVVLLQDGERNILESKVYDVAGLEITA